MIVIYFWHIVCCNLLLQFSGLNLIYILIPGCGTAAIANGDAYEYPEENTDLETFSPEITDPVPEDFFDEPTERVEKVGAFEDISSVSAESEDDNGSNAGNSVSEVTTPLTCVSEQGDSSSVAITETGDETTTSVTSTSCSDAATKSTDMPTEAMETDTTPLPTFVSKPMGNGSVATTQTSDVTTTPPTSTNCSDVETLSTDITTEATETETTPLPTFVSEPMDNGSVVTTQTIDVTTTPPPSTNCSAVETMSTDITTEATETETTPLPMFVSEQTDNSLNLEATTNCSDVSVKSSNLSIESITEETTSSPSSIVSKQENENSSGHSAISSNLPIDSITNTSDFYTIELTAEPMHSESMASQQASVSKQTILIAQPMVNESAINNATMFEGVIVETSSLLNGSVEDLHSAKKLEEIQNISEISNESVIFDSSAPVEPEILTNNSLEQLYDVMGETRSTFSPVYEEGFYDPEKAPTRYGQEEEHLTTSSWKYVSDYGVGLRDYNLILYAVNNSAVLEKGSLLNYVYFVFREIIHVNITLTDIRYCRYLRSKNPDAAKKVPPVLVAFTTMDIKNEILHKRKLLKPTGIKVEHDMPRKLLEEQNALLKPLMDKYRAMGQYVVVRSGKLLVEGKVLTQINLPDKYTYDPLQTFVSYVSTTVKSTTPGMQLPRDIMDYGFGAEKKSGKKKGGKGGGGKKKRKPMIRIPLDEEIGDELSAEILFTTRKFW